MMTNEPTVCDSPMALVAMLRAARIAGDKELERAARQRLLERFGIELVFRRKRDEEVASCQV
jgi:hypothetical protein